MWGTLNDQIVTPLTSWLDGACTFFATNATTVVGFILAMLIIRRVLQEKRNPSNFFAWSLIVVFFPLIGVPLYFILGGRKSRKVARIKREIAATARALTPQPTAAATSFAHCRAQNSRDTSTNGNNCELLPDGESTFHRLCNEIETAQHTIHIATYILSNDQTGKRIAHLLATRARQGVSVRLLLDSLGSWNQTRTLRYKIRRAGGHVAMFMPVLPIQTQISSNLRNHRKIAIFDNDRAITGGQNLDKRFLGATPTAERFVDFSVVTQGPAVAHLTRTFLSDWAFAAKETPAKYRDLLQYLPQAAGDSRIDVITSGPDVDNDPLWEQVLRIIQECQTSLTILTPYFIPDEVLLRSLIVKAHSGRQVRLILPQRSNHPVADIARYHALRQLHQAGVEILFYAPRMLHGKMILADDKVALVGSANIDMRSLFVNFEIALLHYSKADIQPLSDWAQDIVDQCLPYRQVVANKKQMPSRFMENLVHLVAPLL